MRLALLTAALVLVGPAAAEPTAVQPTPVSARLVHRIACEREGLHSSEIEACIQRRDERFQQGDRVTISQTAAVLSELYLAGRIKATPIAMPANIRCTRSELGELDCKTTP